jgi:putative ABC transport system substrate-binding protein
MTSRRRWIAATAALAIAPLARGQAGKPLPRVGVLAPSTREREAVTLKPFFDGMRALGWVEGATVVYDHAYADDRHEAMDRVAAELVARKPDVVYAPPFPAAVSARRATATIPIVFATATDPVGAGLVADLARPGGNVTGITSIIDSLAPKLFELAREILPASRRVGLLGDATDPRSKMDRDSLVPRVARARMELVSVAASSPAELDAAVARLLAPKPVDIVITNSTLTFNLRHRLLELTNARRVPVAGHRAEIADAGALFCYGASLPDQIARSATIVDKILRGESPATIPVEQPTRFETVVNEKAARLLGIKIPPAVLARADRVIE